MTISVVIPCLNAEQFLGEAIESALSQSLQPDEIVVVDDGSTDGSADVAASFGSKVRVVQGPRSGVGAARQAAVTAARGDLVAILDADDIWESDKLKYQVAQFADPSIGLVYCRARRFDRLGLSNKGIPVRLQEGEVFEHLYMRNFVVSPSMVVARRSALIEAGGFDSDLRNAEDVDLWLRVALRWRFAADPRPLCRYRSHDNQLSALRANVVRYGLIVREKHAVEFERRTGMSSRERRELLVKTYLKEVRRMVQRGELLQARALAELLEEAFGSDGLGIRWAIASWRRVAALPALALWPAQSFIGICQSARRR